MNVATGYHAILNGFLGRRPSGWLVFWLNRRFSSIQFAFFSGHFQTLQTHLLSLMWLWNIGPNTKFDMNIEFYHFIIVIIFYWRMFYFDCKIFLYSVLKSNSATVLIKAMKQMSGWKCYSTQVLCLNITTIWCSHFLIILILGSFRF